MKISGIKWVYCELLDSHHNTHTGHIGIPKLPLLPLAVYSLLPKAAFTQGVYHNNRNEI